MKHILQWLAWYKFLRNPFCTDGSCRNVKPYPRWQAMRIARMKSAHGVWPPKRGE